MRLPCSSLIDALTTAQLFEKSTIDKQNVLDAPSFKKGFLVDQDVTYYTKAEKDPVKTVNSLLTLELDGSGKIIRHCAPSLQRLIADIHS